MFNLDAAIFVCGHFFAFRADHSGSDHGGGGGLGVVGMGVAGANRYVSAHAGDQVAVGVPCIIQHALAVAKPWRKHGGDVRTGAQQVG